MLTEVTLIRPADEDTSEPAASDHVGIVSSIIPDGVEHADPSSTDIDAWTENSRANVQATERKYLGARKARVLASAAACSLFLLLGGEESEQLRAALKRKGIKDSGRKNRLYAYVQLFEGPILSQVPEEARRKLKSTVSNYALLWEAMIRDFDAKLRSRDFEPVVKAIVDAGGQDAFAALYKAERDGRAEIRHQDRVWGDDDIAGGTLDGNGNEVKEGQGDLKAEGSGQNGSGPGSKDGAVGTRNAPLPSLPSLFEGLASINSDVTFAVQSGQLGALPEHSFAFLRREEGVVSSLLISDLPVALVSQILKYVDPEDVGKLPALLNSWGDIFRVGQIVADRTTDLVVLPGEDPAAKSTLRVPSQACYLWTEGDDFGIANPRVQASIVLDAKPNVDLGLPKALLALKVKDRDKAQALLAPPRERANRVPTDAKIGEVKAKDGKATVTFPATDAAEQLILHFEPAKVGKADGCEHTWLVKRDEYRSLGGTIVEREGLDLLAKKIKGVIGSRRSAEPLTVTLEMSQVVLQSGNTAPLKINGHSGAAEPLSVRVIGSDLLAVLNGALSATRVKKLTWRADPNGLLEIRFDTAWAQYGAYIPTLLEEGEHYVRNPHLLLPVAI